jgi:hypothetical protein
MHTSLPLWALYLCGDTAKSKQPYTTTSGTSPAPSPPQLPCSTVAYLPAFIFLLRLSPPVISKELRVLALSLYLSRYCLCFPLQDQNFPPAAVCVPFSLGHELPRAGIILLSIWHVSDLGVYKKLLFLSFTPAGAPKRKTVAWFFSSPLT